ncbi:NAD-dependent epimerase/dehydratase family protein [Fulvimarina pelagi]|uniref:NAD-dependent epimerase/dehydratase family protein n=1 Tax=Fulvimarina pelagi TaxID=217511 RepID=UPI0016513F03|nr:NAD-dependent epimerase/dehydratase family protein [Fulvimarina pelagi]
MKILVSGASGFVGRLLVPELALAGHQVIALVRSGTSLPGKVAAPTDLATLPADALSGHGPFDAAIHLAALNPDRSERTSRDETALLRANRDGTVALAKAAATAKIPHFVFLSTANVHGPGNAPIVETSPLRPTTPYARSKAAAEQALADVAAATGIRLTVLRPAPVYGPGGRGMIAALQRLAASRLPVPLPTGLARRSFVSRVSLVQAIVAVIAREAEASETYGVADEAPMTPEEIIAGLRRAEGRRPGILPLPTSLLAVAAKPLGGGQTLQNLQKTFAIDWSKLASQTTWSPEPDTIAALLRRSPAL